MFYHNTVGVYIYHFIVQFTKRVKFKPIIPNALYCSGFDNHALEDWSFFELVSFVDSER